MSESILLEGADGVADRARTPRAFVKSFGCQMNVYDSQRMADLAAGQAMARPTRSRTPSSSFSTPATFANARPTRSIPSSAGCVSSRRHTRGPGHPTMLVVAGCVAQAEGAGGRTPPTRGRSRRRTASYHRLPDLFREARRRPGVVDTDFPVDDKFLRFPRPRATPFADAASPPSSPCRRAATSSARSASCPTRGAPRSRGRWLACSTRSPISRGGGARGHAHRAERQRLSWGRRAAARSDSPRSSAPSPPCRGSPACATPPRIPPT